MPFNNILKYPHMIDWFWLCLYVGTIYLENDFSSWSWGRRPNDITTTLLACNPNFFPLKWCGSILIKHMKVWIRDNTQTNTNKNINLILRAMFWFAVIMIWSFDCREEETTIASLLDCIHHGIMNDKNIMQWWTSHFFFCEFLLMGYG